MVGIPLSFHFNGACHFGSDHGAHVSLPPGVTGKNQLFYSDPDHSPIQHNRTKLDGDPQTKRGRGLKDKHWNTLIIIFDLRNPDSSFYIPLVCNGEPPCSL